MKKIIEFDCYDSFEEASAAARERFSKHFTEEEMEDMEERMWLFDDGMVLVCYSLLVGKRFGNRFSLVRLPKEDEEEEEEECDECRLVPRAED